jgi:hypothetical protein
MRIVSATVLLALFSCATAGPAPVAVAFPVPAAPSGPNQHNHMMTAKSGPTPAALKALLFDIADWIMTTGVGKNELNNASYSSCLDSIFINGNLARVLLAAHKIDGGQQHPEYLGEGLAWCDTLCALQLPITTSTGKSAGYWDTGYSQVYIADTGSAVAALAVCHSLADPARQATYEAALAKFTLFVTEGCSAPPPKPDVYSTACPPKGTGWVIAGGKDAGALGDGYCPYR